MKTSVLIIGPSSSRFFAKAAAFIAFASAITNVSAQIASYPATILSNKPVAYYELQEPPGSSTAFDSSPNAFDASYDYDPTSASPALGFPGIASNSIAFLGNVQGNYGSIDIPYSPLLSPMTSDGAHGAPFSIECWVKAYSDNAQGGIYLSIMGMFGEYADTGAYVNASGWLLGQTPGPGSQWLFNMKNAGFLTSDAITPGQWTHLVGTFDGTNQNFYVNAQLAAQTVVAGFPGYLADNGSDGSIGAVINAGFPPYGPWLGGVDQVAFYTNALTPEQISNDYAIGTNSFNDAPTAPLIVTQPETETNYSGTMASFSVVAIGTAPLYYQWNRLGSGPIPGATNTTYSFISHYPADDGAVYLVTVSNALAVATSDYVTNGVSTDIVIQGPPFSITRNVGSHAAFRVAAIGALPLSYQWSASSDGGATFQNLPGQTSDTLWLTNVQMSASGNQYAVVVTNPFTSFSSAAILTVQPRAVNVPLTGYAALVAADNPVAYWRLDEPTGSTNAVDAVGTFDGAYSTNVGNIVYGIATGIPNDLDPAVDLQDMQSTNAGQGGQVDIPYALELNPWGAWSAEAWVRPDAVDGAIRVPFSSLSDTNYEDNETGWNIYQFPDPGSWVLNIFNGGSDSGYTGTDDGHTPLVPGAWYYLVVTDDGTNIQLWVNAVAGDANTTVAASGFLPNGFNGDTNVGGSEEVIGQGSDAAYNGANAGLDDVAFYNYALSAAQIQSHYLNKVQLTISGTAPQLVLTWSAGVLLGSTNVNGPFTPVSNATSPYTVPTTSGQYLYQVVVH